MVLPSPGRKNQTCESQVKTTEDVLNDVRAHINSLPRMEPHYTRSDTNRQFLGAGLNINKMYELYVENCKARNAQYVKSGVYRSVFCSEFNLHNSAVIKFRPDQPNNTKVVRYNIGVDHFK